MLHLLTCIAAKQAFVRFKTGIYRAADKRSTVHFKLQLDPEHYQIFSYIFLATCAAYHVDNAIAIEYTRDPINGRYPYGTYVTIRCKYGYYKTNSDDPFCHDDKTWISPDVRCNKGNVL